jgi:nucleoside-diphosphate-sugar epimerase
MSIVAEDIARILAEDLPWRQLSGAAVLITGANGFLPAYLVRTLLALNDSGRLAAPLRILALVRRPQRAKQSFGALLDRPDITLIEHDMGTPFTYDAPVDFIIHAASQASPKYYGADPVGTLAPNVIGTHSLLSLAHARNAKAFLMFSSSEVYGDVKAEDNPIREDQYGYLDPARVRACYSESKRMAETMCVAWAHQFGVPAKIVRPFHTYGPGVALDDGRIFADFVADILARRNLAVKSDGNAVRAFCYLADATAGFLRVLLKGETGVAYNVGNDRAISSIGDLARTLAAEFKERQLAVVFEPRQPDQAYISSMVSCNYPDISRMRALGWQPTIGIAEGFRRTVTSFEEKSCALS